MKIRKEMNTYCPFCRKHHLHKVRVAGKGRARSMAAGTRAHERSLLGHGGKRAGEKTVKKQGKTQRLMLECTQCKKKQLRLIKGRTTKKIEVKA